MRERIKDYRRLNLNVQNYFRGNTAARRRRIRALQERIFSKHMRKGMISFFSMLESI